MVARLNIIIPIVNSGRVKFVKANKFKATKLIVTVVFVSFANKALSRIICKEIQGQTGVDGR